MLLFEADGVERLDQVVVGARFQPCHAIGHRVARGEDQHRHVAAPLGGKLAQAGQERHASTRGKPRSSTTSAYAACNALASEHCTLEPRNKWISTADMKAKVEQKGLTVQRIETVDGCYEVSATNQRGDRIKLTMHPLSAAVMEEEIKYAQPATPAPTAAR